jgi:hypothetical protein
MEEFSKGDTVNVFYETDKGSIKGFICFQDIWIEYDTYRIIEKSGKIVDVVGGQGSIVCTCRMVLTEKIINFEKYMVKLDGGEQLW